MLTPFLPYRDAPAGFPQATFARLRLLARSHTVQVATFSERHERQKEQDLQSIGVKVYSVPRDAIPARSTASLYWKRARLLFALLVLGEPLLVAEFGSRRMRRMVDRLLNSNRFDVVLVEHMLMWQYAKKPYSVPVVLSDHDVRAGLPLRGETGTRGVRGVAAKVDTRNWRYYLKSAWNEAHALIVPTSSDSRLLARLVPSTRPQVVPFGLLPQACTGADGVASRESDLLLFVGNFNHPPNRGAALRLANEIFPIVRAARPAVKLLLVGKDPTPEIRSLDGEGVTVTGEVESVAPYLARCALFVAPIRGGGGVRIKLLEAMSAGAPVITTKTGAQGLDAEPGVHLLIANDSRDFAACVLRALDDPSLRDKIAAAGRALACSPQREEEAARLLEQLLESVVSQQGIAPGAAEQPLRHIPR